MKLEEIKDKINLRQKSLDDFNGYSDAEKQIARKIFKRIYSIASNRIEVKEEDNKHVLRVKLETGNGATCYQVKYDENGNFEFSKDNEAFSKKAITVCGYDDKKAFSETYTSSCFKNYKDAVRDLITEFAEFRIMARTTLADEIEAAIK